MNIRAAGRICPVPAPSRKVDNEVKNTNKIYLYGNM